MTDQSFTQSQVDGLIAKLLAVDFTDEEQSILSSVFQVAARAAADVEGFGNVRDLGTLVGSITIVQTGMLPSSLEFWRNSQTYDQGAPVAPPTPKGPS